MMSWLLLFHLSATPTQAAPDWNTSYDRAATVGLVSGITAPTVPPIASAVTFAILREQMGPPPNLLSSCNNGGIGAVICVLLFPVLVITQVVATYIWVVLPLAKTFVYTAPLYAAGPAFLTGSAMRGRRALNELGGDVPGTWGHFSWGLYGVETVGLLGTTLALTIGGGGASFTLPLAVAGWTGSLTSGLLQWRVNRRHNVGLAGAKPAANRRMEFPMVRVGGVF